jgi:high-affinity nickel-transport protein
MIPVNTLDGVLLRSAFSRIFNIKAFKYMTFALSAVAPTIAAIESYSIISNSNIVPPLTGPILAVMIILFAFGYAFVTCNSRGSAGHVRVVIDQQHNDGTYSDK